MANGKPAENEPPPPEFREFLSNVRELFREIRKFVLFLRREKNVAVIMAVFTFFLALFAFIQAFLLGLQIRPLQNSADAAQKAAGTASRQLEMADRPWLKEIVSSNAPFLIDNGSISWAIRVQVTNVGHSVATGAFVEGELIALHGADYVDGPANEMNRFCDKIAKTSPINPRMWGISVFPTDTNDLLGPSVIIFKPDVESASVDGGATLGKSIFPILVGCIDYQYPTSETRHQTRFIYDVFYRDPKTGTNQPFVSLGKTLPMNDMVLWRHRVSGQFAY
jgi:hypothetical protein